MNQTTEISEVYDLGLGDFLHTVWRRRRNVLAITAVVAVAAVVLTLVIPVKYTAVTTILPPQTSETGSLSSMSDIRGLAADFLPGPTDVFVKVYPEIAVSRYTLSRVLSSPFGSGTILDALDEKSWGSLDAEDALEALGESIVDATVDLKSDVVSITAMTSDPELSAAVANAVVTYMGDFITHQFKTAATSQRIMIEERLTEVADTLRIAEDRLLSFRENNRSIALSPALKTAELRLVRNVDLHSTLYVELSRQLELAKISEIQVKPVLNILDRAVPPAKKSWPPRRKLVMVMTMTGLCLSVIGVYFQDRMKRTRANPALGRDSSPVS